MTDAPTHRLIASATEALAIARGEIPAARLHIDGHSYVPLAELQAAESRLKELTGALEGIIARDRQHWRTDLSVESRDGPCGTIARTALSRSRAEGV